jgi:hypothetical protein
MFYIPYIFFDLSRMIFIRQWDYMNMSFKKIFYYVDITKNQYFQTNQSKEKWFFVWLCLLV